jgi:hypothetical protein
MQHFVVKAKPACDSEQGSIVAERVSDLRLDLALPTVWL